MTTSTKRNTDHQNVFGTTQKHILIVLWKYSTLAISVASKSEVSRTFYPTCSKNSVLAGRAAITIEFSSLSAVSSGSLSGGAVDFTFALFFLGAI